MKNVSYNSQQSMNFVWYTLSLNDDWAHTLLSRTTTTTLITLQYIPRRRVLPHIQGSLIVHAYYGFGTTAMNNQFVIPLPVSWMCVVRWGCGGPHTGSFRRILDHKLLIHRWLIGISAEIRDDTGLFKLKYIGFHISCPQNDNVKWHEICQSRNILNITEYL